MKRTPVRKTTRSKADMLLLGIDVGTSMIKVGAYDPEGNVRGLRRFRQRLLRPKPGWAEMDPRDWWRKICRGVHELLDEEGMNADQVASIGLSCLCPCAMLLDDQGNAITPAIFHQDRRGQAAWRRLPPRVLKKAFRITGNTLMPGTASLLSLLWLQEHCSEEVARAAAYGHANTLLGLKLTGALGIDGSQAALSGLLDLRRHCWSEELCGIFEVDPRLLPPLVPSFGRLGELSRASAKSLGLRSGIPVCMGGADTACAALGLGKSEPGDAFLLSGTTDVLGVVVSPPLADPRLILRPHVRDNAWLLLGTVSSAGASLQWAKSVLRLRGGLAAPFSSRAREAGDERAGFSGQPSDNGDVSPYHWPLTAPLFLPHLTGERTGICDPQAQGAFLGLRLETTPEDLWAAVLEGTAMGLREALELLESCLGRPLATLACAGGGTTDRRWLQIKADTLGRPLAIARHDEAALFGAALLGGLAAGVYGSQQEMLAISRRANPTALVRPDPRRAQGLVRRYNVFKQCYARLRSIFSQLSQLDDPACPIDEEIKQ